MVRAVPLLLVLAAAAALGAPPKGRKKERKPAPEARALFRKRCSACHDPSRVYHRAASRDEWREIVDRMRRMPQSGISPGDAKIILDYLVTLGGGGAPAAGGVHGGRKVYGAGWLAILETARVKDGRVTIGGKRYAVERDGLRATLVRENRRWVLALPEPGQELLTARIDSWRVGKIRYEVHLVLYRIRGEHVRIGRALRRRP